MARIVNPAGVPDNPVIEGNITAVTGVSVYSVDEAAHKITATLTGIPVEDQPLHEDTSSSLLIYGSTSELRSINMPVGETFPNHTAMGSITTSAEYRYGTTQMSVGAGDGVSSGMGLFGLSAGVAISGDPYPLGDTYTTASVYLTGDHTSFSIQAQTVDISADVDITGTFLVNGSPVGGGSPDNASNIIASQVFG